MTNSSQLNQGKSVLPFSPTSNESRLNRLSPFIKQHPIVIAQDAPLATLDKKIQFLLEAINTRESEDPTLRLEGGPRITRQTITNQSYVRIRQYYTGRASFDEVSIFDAKKINDAPQHPNARPIHHRRSSSFFNPADLKALTE